MFTYYLAESYDSNQHTAGIVRKDNEKILGEMGFTELRFRHTKAGSAITKLRRAAELAKLLFRVRKNSLVVFHFPMLAKAHIALFKMLHRRGIKTAAIIIDIDGLRYHNKDLLQHEMAILQQFTYVIAHNNAMKNYLSPFTGEEKIFCIELFDYPYKDIAPDRKPGSIVCFAGNFEKASFVYKLHKLQGIVFNLYGEKYNGTASEYVSYKGAFPPAVLPQHLEGNFGLVWDGTSTDNCDEYLQYNHPHKFSLYLAAGMPVLVWEKSAIAPFVTGQKIGLTINTLAEIPGKIKLISADEYDVMKKNVSVLRQDVINGEHLRSVIKKITG